jgi:molybdenum cofactor guanylyltransferase
MYSRFGPAHGELMDIEAYILIGGCSSRLGRDKAFVRVAGTSLAQRAIETVRRSKVAGKLTCVTGSDTQFAIEAITLDAPFIFDLIPGRGPLGGLHAALSNAESEWIFLLACDMPLVTPELIDLLGSRVSNEEAAVVPVQSDGRVQPLCAFYRKAATKPVVEEIISLPRASPPMAQIVERLNAKTVGFGEYEHLAGAEAFFTNVNTPAELEEVVRML